MPVPGGGPPDPTIPDRPPRVGAGYRMASGYFFMDTVPYLHDVRTAIAHRIAKKKASKGVSYWFP